MKITVQTSDISGALARLKAIAGRKATLPILNSVLLRAAGDHLSLAATDLDVHLTVIIKATVEEDGEIAVSCPRLFAAVSKIDGDELELETEKTFVRGSAGEMSFKLISFAASEFPPVPASAQIGRSVVMEKGILAAALAKVLPCASDDDTRYVLCGAHFAIDEGELRAIATDGRRLVRVGIKAVSSASDIAVTVPTDAVKLMACLDGGGATRVDFAEQYVTAEGDGWSLVAKLIDGNYPDWRQVIPKAEDGKHQTTVARKAFLDALPFVETVCAKGSMKVTLTSDGKSLTIQANGPDIGETTATLPATVKGGKLAVGFNPDFLSDALKAVDGETITLAMADEMSPVRIDENGATIVIMPMRVV